MTQCSTATASWSPLAVSHSISWRLQTNTALGEIGALITFIALIGSIMVSYVRARAEGLGIECKIGLMQRPERVVITSLAALATGIVGKTVDMECFNALYILIVGMAIIAVFANITAFARINHCRRELTRLKK